MKIITGARQTGKTTELIRLAHKTYSRILCTSMSHCNSIQEIANKLELNIKPPITIKQFIKNPYKFRRENIAIDDVLHCFFQTLPIFGVTCITLGIEENQEFQLLKVNETVKNLQKNYSHTDCSNYVLGECSIEHGNNNGNCVGTDRCIKNLEQKLIQCHSELDSESKKLKAKEQECEELKRTISTLEGVNKLFENNLDSSFIKIVHYKQALEKIEEIADSNRCEGDNCDECPFACECNLKDMTNIINEVKDV